MYCFSQFLIRRAAPFSLLLCLMMVTSGTVFSQGVTTASLNGLVTSSDGQPLVGTNVIAVHTSSGTRYGGSTRITGQYNLQNMRVGGPYTVTATILGYKSESQENVYLSLGQDLRIDFKLAEEAVIGQEVVVTAQTDDVLNSGRTGAATFINPGEVQQLPSIKRSTRDLTRLDPRSDGNYSFAGKNWLFNSISLDGSYFNNSFGLDDPAPGGQSNAEPVPFDAVEQVQVSVAPYDVREGGFTGAGVNTVTKSGTNQVKGSAYTFLRNESLVGNKVRGKQIVANPDLTYNQSGFSISGPIVQDKFFFFINAEIERRKDPGSNFVASRNGSSGLGVSRVTAAIMDSIRNRMMTVYGYDTGPYEGYIHETKNEKVLVKLDWNVNENNNLSFRYNILNASRQQGPHPFVLSFGNTGRGPNENSLPFSNSGYRINNKLSSFALEVNSRAETFANRFFTSYNRFRDNRDPFSVDFPTLEIGEGGVTYTTVGHEPFSIHNILDQDVWQFTNNFSYFAGNHVVTVGGTYEIYSFFNSFNIFRHGLFGLPFASTTFFGLDDFFRRTNPTDTNFIDLRGMITPNTSPFKGEDIKVSQLGFYAQDEFLVSERFNLTYGLRVDLPIYNTKPVANPYSTGLTALDENGNPEVIDQAKLPDVKPLFSPRVGFNWDASGDRSTQLRGGSGIFTGRLPFVWIGNVISNPGANPNLPSYQRSFDLNAAVPDFKWPQVWTSNIAVDHQLPGGILGTLEFLYGKDINAVFLRNADLVRPVRTLADGRPYYGGGGSNELNPDFGAGIYVIDNTNEGYNYTITAQFRKAFDFGLTASLAYTYLQAKSALKSTEIASVLFAENPVKGDPNKPQLSYSEFGERNRITASGTYRVQWSDRFATSFGLFVEVGEGNRFAGAGGNRYSFLYAGDVNGDGFVNDLIYIPLNQADARLVPFTGAGGTVAEQWAALDAFIKQDDYLNSHRGQIADRFGALNPWFSNIDLRILQDIIFPMNGSMHTFQISLDILNVANLLNSEWGVRSIATSSATSPLELAGFDGAGNPQFNFRGLTKGTFVDDPGLNSRWQAQLGIRYIFN
ncbi:MAG TPA: carboxypeptidase regulatory-like domain-containing protein [Bacteroidota bacterium]